MNSGEGGLKRKERITYKALFPFLHYSWCLACSQPGTACFCPSPDACHLRAHDGIYLVLQPETFILLQDFHLLQGNADGKKNSV